MGFFSKQEVQAGDVVTLKSGGGPEMTVAKISGSEAECMWISDDGDLQTAPFPIIVLKVK